jgi:hypothetical protein
VGIAAKQEGTRAVGRSHRCIKSDDGRLRAERCKTYGYHSECNETSKPEDLGPTARREEGQTDI